MRTQGSQRPCQLSDVSRSQRNYILRTWVRHYNVERPHRGRDADNNVLQVDFRSVRDGPIRRNRQLGGIVTSYTRDALKRARSCKWGWQPPKVAYRPIQPGHLQDAAHHPGRLS